MDLAQKLMAMVFGGLVATSPSHVPAPVPVSLDEMLTYECARHVVELIPQDAQWGPVFFRKGLVFMSLSFASGTSGLLVNAGAGQFVVPLTGSGVNRLRFQIPGKDSLESKVFYISYSHGGSRNSRLYEFSEHNAPSGRADLDYQWMIPQRASQYISHLEFAVFETVDAVVGAYSTKRLSPESLAAVNIRSCDHLTRKSPSLARSIRYDLEILKSATKPTYNRMPASLAHLR